MSPFRSRDKANPGIPLFYEQDFRNERDGRSFLSSDVHGAFPFYQTWEAVSSFHIFVICTFLHVLRTHWGSFRDCDGNLVSFLVCSRIDCYIALIHWSVCLPTEYFCVNLLSFDNLLHYKKRCVICAHLVKSYTVKLRLKIYFVSYPTRTGGTTTTTTTTTTHTHTHIYIYIYIYVVYC